MKKCTLYLLVIMASFMSCDATIMDENPSCKEILFTQLNNKLTRSHGSLQPNSFRYKIFAKKSYNTPNWYIADEVCSQKGCFDHLREGPYYWPETSTLDFYAFAPSNLASTKSKVINDYVLTRAGVHHSLLMNYTVPTDATEDFVIAMPKKRVDHTRNGEVVQLVFTHVLSKLNVHLSLSDELLRSGYELSPDYTVQLVVHYDQAVIDMMASEKVWKKYGSSCSGMVAYESRSSFYVLPQSSIGCSLQLKNIKITKNDVLVYPLNGASGDLSPHKFKEGDISGRIPNYFVMGENYNFNIQLSHLSKTENGTPILGAAIEFDSSVADWTR